LDVGLLGWGFGETVLWTPLRKPFEEIGLKSGLEI
jgi:hypothetical protein